MGSRERDGRERGDGDDREGGAHRVGDHRGSLVDVVVVLRFGKVVVGLVVSSLVDAARGESDSRRRHRPTHSRGKHPITSQ